MSDMIKNIMDWESLKVIGYIVLVLIGTALVALIEYRNNQKGEAIGIILFTFAPFGLALLCLGVMGIIQNFTSDEILARVIFAPVFIIMLGLFVFAAKKIDKKWSNSEQRENE